MVGNHPHQVLPNLVFCLHWSGCSTRSHPEDQGPRGLSRPKGYSQSRAPGASPELYSLDESLQEPQTARQHAPGGDVGARITC